MRPSSRLAIAIIAPLIFAALLAGCASGPGAGTASASPSASAKQADPVKTKTPKTGTTKTVSLPVSDCSLLSSTQVAAAAGDGASVSGQAVPPSLGGTKIESCLYEAGFSDRLEGIGVEVARFADGSGAKHLLSMSVALPGKGSTDHGFDVEGLPEPVRTAVGTLAKTSTAAAETSVGPYVMLVTTTGQPSAAAAGSTASTLLKLLVAKAKG